MNRVTANRSRSVRPARAAAALGLAAALLGACAPKATDKDLRAELASLREEHQVLLAEIEALKGELRQLTAGEPAAIETTTPAEAPGAVPPPPALSQPVSRASAAIAAVLDAYRQALEAEDMERVDEIYGGSMPTADLRYLELWFDRTEELQVNMDPRSIDVQGEAADAVISQTMAYRLSRTAEQRTLRLDVRMTFERRGNEWRLVRVQAGR